MQLYYGFSLRRQMAPQHSTKFRTARFCQFRSSLGKDSIAIYGEIWTHFPPSVRCSLQRTKHFIVSSVGGATKFAMEIFLTYKIGLTVMQNTSYGYCIEIVINSTHVIGIIMRVTIYPAGMHCPRWRDDAFGF